MGLLSQRLQRSAGQCGGGDLGVRAPRSPLEPHLLAESGRQTEAGRGGVEAALGRFQGNAVVAGRSPGGRVLWFLLGAFIRREEGVDILRLLGMSP